MYAKPSVPYSISMMSTRPFPGLIPDTVNVSTVVVTLKSDTLSGSAKKDIGKPKVYVILAMLSRLLISNNLVLNNGVEITHIQTLKLPCSSARIILQ